MTVSKVRCGLASARCQLPFLLFLALALVSPSVASAQSGVPDLGDILSPADWRPDKNLFEMGRRPIEARESILRRMHNAYQRLRAKWEAEDRDLKNPRSMTDAEMAEFMETSKIPESYLKDREAAKSLDSEANDANPDNLPTVLPEKKVGDDDADESDPELEGEVPDPKAGEGAEEEEGTEGEKERLGPRNMTAEFVARLLSISLTVPSVIENTSGLERVRPAFPRSDRTIAGTQRDASTDRSLSGIPKGLFN